uniref:Chaperone NapD n=1 Tax=Candidatus Kentrum sp. TC TaxID=2126339 RepID=A0A450Z8C3_9GAMM|nr:MAG: nitrate reductase NapD [Candidatus Kentron sp. TC]VFK50034.1 MAG: periplasmic nitrate reductase chaperone NapD [Candidatus Kentron sp. TC]VFK63112.1 MAG: nitrate reductase NapD [Candidatus Kentron sp. TC]
MDICSILLFARPERLSSVQDTLHDMEGVEVHAATPDGRIVVSVEKDNQEQFSETVLTLRGIGGVIDANLVYHFHEDDFEDAPVEINERGNIP